MEKVEALLDAIQQFTTQGVDLTNVDTTGADREQQRRATAAALASLKAAVTARDGAPLDEPAVRAALLALAAGCTHDPPNAADDAEGLDGGAVRLAPAVVVNQAVVAMAQGPAYLAALLGHEPLASDALDCLVVVCRHSVECRDAFPPQGMAVLAKILSVQAELGAKLLSEGPAAAAPAGASALNDAAVAPPAAAAPAGGTAPRGLAVAVATGTYSLAAGRAWVYTSAALAAAPAANAPAVGLPVSDAARGRGQQSAAFLAARSLCFKCCLAVHVLALRTENNKQGFVRKEAGGLPALHLALKVPPCVRL